MDWTFPLWKEGEFCVCVSLVDSHWGVLIPWAYASFHTSSATSLGKAHLSNIYTAYCRFLRLCVCGGCGQRHYAFGMFACLSRRMYVRSTLTESLQIWDIHSLNLKNELLMVVGGQRSRLLWSYIYSFTELLCRNIYIWSSVEDYNIAARQMVGLKTGPQCKLNEWRGQSAGRGMWWGNSGEGWAERVGLTSLMKNRCRGERQAGEGEATPTQRGGQRSSKKHRGRDTHKKTSTIQMP